MTTAIENQSREERVKHFLSLGHDRAQAENLTDGRPEWSQRIVDNGPDYTKSEVYQAQARHNAENVSKRPEEPNEHEFDNIMFQISNWQNVRDDADWRITEIEKKRALAKELLDDSKGFTDQMAADDTQRATKILRTTEEPLKEQQRRVKNAEAQLKVWRKRLNEFPKEELQRLKRQHQRRVALQF